MTFKPSDSRSAGQKRILSWNSHSRSFTLQSFAGRQGVEYRHKVSGRHFVNSHGHIYIACRIREVFEDVATLIAKNSRRRQPPMWFDAHTQGNPREYPHEPYIFRN